MSGQYLYSRAKPRGITLKNKFLFDGIIYQHIDGVAMGSPLSPSLANALLAHYQQIWLNDCPDEFEPYVIKDVWMIYLFYFHLLTTLNNLMNI